MNLPISISLVFILISFTTVFIFFLASHKNFLSLAIISIYLIAQGILAYFNFYNEEPLVVAKIPLIVAPSFILLFMLLFSTRGKRYIQTLNLKTLTILHVIRIPIELVLFMLFTHKAIPEVMTFEGRNFDIIAGITAPIIYYLAFVKNIIESKILLIWNIVCLGLLINIIVHAVLSFETPFQQFGQLQPNRAILYFPFIWLPAVVVPIVFFSHCAAIQRLININNNPAK